MNSIYRFISRTYRIILGLCTVFFLALTFAFTSIEQYDDYSGIIFLLFSLITLAFISVFHQLDKNNRYKKVLQFIVFCLVLTSFIFLVSMLIMMQNNNYIISGFTFVITFINLFLLYFLFFDRKYNY